MVRSALLSSLVALTVALPAFAQDAPPPAVSDVGAPEATVAAPAPLSESQGEPAPSSDAPPAATEPMADSGSDAPPPSMTSVNDSGDAGHGGGTQGANNTIGSRFYIAPMMSYVFADKSRDTDDGYGGALALGKKFGDALAIEANGYYNRFSDNVAGGDGAAETFGGGLSLLLAPLPSFRDVYLIATGAYGITKNLPGAPDDNYKSWLYGAGLGYLLQLTDGGTALRAEAIYRVDDHKQSDAGAKNFEDVVFNLGLMIPLGGKAEPEVTDSTTPAAVVPIGADDDNDGVPNELDQCPATPAGAIVNAQGCENDEDGDGVVDRLDRCPSTPAGTPVNEEGCPVAKGCKTPEPGQAITLEGCAAGDTIVLQGVTFEFDKARLTPNAKVILDGVGDALVAKPEIKVEVGGHTDAKGSDAYNLKLSDSRAQAVEQYLIGRGIAASRLSAKGYGESMPVADNDTDEGRELNRRVELKIAP
ncbi:OmpA family protein [Hydrocarboniphaga sp.]|uniref:OmpA family protein n=1 Tax=Hydrocarboniphaga sp. TaxID=2033016 RepID=UPI003D13ECDE